MINLPGNQALHMGDIFQPNDGIYFHHTSGAVHNKYKKIL